MFKSSSVFDKLLDKATSLSNLEPDWASILQICDSIRQNDVQPKYALGAIKKKLYVTNPNVVLMTLRVLESCVKNCGSVFHIEVATKQFMEDIHDVLRQTTDVNVRDAILRLVQALAHAFRNEPSYRAVSDKVKVMKIEGYQFPEFKESDAMFSADTAPEWADGECCHRCRVQFTMVVRKHHCRHCGQVFCAKCSSKMSTIPKFGIEKEVRVCDFCFDKINRKVDIKPNQVPEDTKTKSSTTSTSQPNKKSEQEIQEEEELQLALALSKSEAESKERERARYSQFTGVTKAIGNVSSNSYSSPSTGKSKKSSKSKSSKSSSKKSSSKTELPPSENDDPELARYLNREYWEQRSTAYADYEPSPSPSAPQPSMTSVNKTSTGDVVESKTFINKDKLSNVVSNQNDDELELFANSLRSTIEIFVNRLNSNKLRGRPITNDNGVQSLFMNLTNLHSQLIMYTQQTNEARSNCERLQDKISQIRDARAALDALRDEHREQLRRAAEEAERIRQQQMAQKLEIMRKKKQEYLQYQRELAIQRMQEQEMMIRSDQFKFANPNAAVPPPGVGQQQWTNPIPVGAPGAGGYYVPNHNFPGVQQPSMGSPMQGQYVQSTIPNNSNMVTSQQAAMVSTVATVPGAPQQQPPVPSQPQQSLPSQAQFIGQIPQMNPPNMYMAPGPVSMPPSVPSNPQVSSTPYQMGPPPSSAPAHQQQPPPQQVIQPPPPPPPPSQTNEELLIKFD